MPHADIRFVSVVSSLAILGGTALGGATVAGCSNAEPIAIEAPIVGGTVGGDEAVVWIYNTGSGGLCSGVLIEPRVVLTAKHCVQEPDAEGPNPPRQLFVGLGNTANRGATFTVQSIATTPGVYFDDDRRGLSGALVGQDVAVMVLATGIPDVVPMPVRRTHPSDLAGQIITATGYGQIPSGRAGTKYTATGEVTGVSGDLIYVGSLICSGDSGGPMITAEREVAGVVSFGNADACGSGFGAYNALHSYWDLIDAAIEEGGGCVNDEEVESTCDGSDNDCDGMVDETCTPIGGACASDDECVGNMCRETSAGTICTRECDARRPDLGCGDGLYCARSVTSACDGLCIPQNGDATLPNDASCTADAQCASLFCNDPGDGNRRCLTACESDSGMCFAGEVCVAGSGACGGCVPSRLVGGLAHGIGEPCAVDTECGSGSCLEDDGSRYCSRSCDEDTACPSAFHCRGGSCVRGALGGIGESCVDSEDCGGDRFCALRGDASWCTSVCSDSMPCPEAFACVDAGGTLVCAPTVGLVGSTCATAADCISGICGSDLVCVRECGVDAPCGPGFECRRTEDGASALCVTPRVETSGGSCAVSNGAVSSGRGDGWLLTVLASCMIAALARRRRRTPRV